MSANKSTASEGRNSQYQSPETGLKLPSLQDQLSMEKQQTTETLHFSTKNLVPKISNMHLVNSTHYQDGIITEESPRLEAEGPAKHIINFFQDRISTAREQSLCNRKACEQDTLPNLDDELVFQLTTENNLLKKQQEVLNEKIRSLEKDKQELIIALSQTERSLQESLKSHREESLYLYRRLESYREHQESNQILSAHSSINKSGRVSNEQHHASIGQANDVSELIRRIQKIEIYSNELINANFYLQTELNALKKVEGEDGSQNSNKNISELQKEFDSIKKFIKKKFQMPQSVSEIKSEDSSRKYTENLKEDSRDTRRADKEKKEIIPSMLKALYLGDSIGSPEKGTPRKP